MSGTEPGVARTVRTTADADDHAAVAAGWIAEIVAEALAVRGRCTVALSGGRTPVAPYRTLARSHGGRLPWDRIHLFQSDERMVPADHPDSNQAMIRRELLDLLDAPHDRFHAIPVDGVTAEEAADRYHDEIRHFFALAERRHPRFDLVLLGLGGDGHTASLFPGCPALEDTTRLASVCRPVSASHDRVTLTLPVVNAARTVLFLVTGEDKAAALARVLEGDTSTPPLPAARVQPGAGELRWLIDRGAAADLPPAPGRGTR